MNLLGYIPTVVSLYMDCHLFIFFFFLLRESCIGKQRALSCEVTCTLRLYLKIGRTSVKPSWKHWIFTNNYHSLHTYVHYVIHCVLVRVTYSRRNYLINSNRFSVCPSQSQTHRIFYADNDAIFRITHETTCLIIYSYTFHYTYLPQLCTTKTW